MYHMNKRINHNKIAKVLGMLIVGSFLIAILSGCGLVGEKKIKIFSVEESRAKLNIDKPTPLQMEKIRWIIITSANAEEVFAKLEQEGIDPVLFGLTDKDYEIIAKNFAQIRAKLKESNEILDKYKEYYESDGKSDSKQQ